MTLKHCKHTYAHTDSVSTISINSTAVAESKNCYQWLTFIFIFIAVCKEPPYEVSESGYAGFEFPIDIYFKSKSEPRKIRFNYDLFLQLADNPPVHHIRCEKLTFQNPDEDFKSKLLKSGGVSYFCLLLIYIAVAGY